MATTDPRGSGACGPALTPELTLNELVALLPGAEGPLLHLGYDTCCGGSRTLQEASRALGLDAYAVLKEVAGDRWQGSAS